MPTNEPRAVTLTAEEIADVHDRLSCIESDSMGCATITRIRAILAAAEARAREEKDQVEQDAAIMAERRRDGVLWHGFYRVSTDSGTWMQRSRIVASDKPIVWPHGWCVRFENYRTDKADGYWEEAEPDDWIDILGALFKDLASAPPAASGPTDAELIAFGLAGYSMEGRIKIDTPDCSQPPQWRLSIPTPAWFGGYTWERMELDRAEDGMPILTDAARAALRSAKEAGR